MSGDRQPALITRATGNIVPCLVRMPVDSGRAPRFGHPVGQCAGLHRHAAEGHRLGVDVAALMQNVLESVPVIRRGLFPQISGRGVPGWIDTWHMAAVAAEVLVEQGHGGGAYVLTGSELLSVLDLAAQLTSVLGRRARLPAPAQWPVLRAPASYRQRPVHRRAPAPSVRRRHAPRPGRRSRVHRDRPFAHRHRSARLRKVRRDTLTARRR